MSTLAEKPSVVKRVSLAVGSTFSNSLKKRRARMFEKWALASESIEKKAARFDKAIELHERVAVSSVRRGKIKRGTSLLNGRKNFKRAYKSYGEAARVSDTLANEILLAEDYLGAATEFTRASGFHDSQVRVLLDRHNLNSNTSEKLAPTRLGIADAKRYAAAMYAVAAKDNPNYPGAVAFLKKATESQHGEIMLRREAGDTAGIVSALRIEYTILSYMHGLANKNNDACLLSSTRDRIDDNFQRLATAIDDHNRKKKDTVSNGFDLDAYKRAGEERLTSLGEQNVITNTYSDMGAREEAESAVGDHSAIFEQNKLHGRKIDR